MLLELTMKFLCDILGVAIAVDCFLIGRAIFLLHSTTVKVMLCMMQMFISFSIPHLNKIISEIVMFQLCFLRVAMEMCSEKLNLRFRLTNEEGLVSENEPLRTSCELPEVSLRQEIHTDSEENTVTEDSDSLYEGNSQPPDDVDLIRIAAAVSTVVQRLTVGLRENWEPSEKRCICADPTDLNDVKAGGTVNDSIWKISAIHLFHVDITGCDSGSSQPSLSNHVWLRIHFTCKVAGVPNPNRLKKLGAMPSMSRFDDVVGFVRVGNERNHCRCSTTSGTFTPEAAARKVLNTESEEDNHFVKGNTAHVFHHVMRQKPAPAIEAFDGDWLGKASLEIIVGSVGVVVNKMRSNEIAVLD
ncbi:hypothetical protein TTRE_0000363501 [Trichuris trichiura]|uniref:Uncharacterized protein n=1 Tax=Trichuris trichiura TaxID=36087 RepID=A0A077Z6V8_TRITR|nr:hypothetical protein TTRE_0000363501 [Trichuris trichiura]